MRVARSVFQLHAAPTSLAPGSAPKLASKADDYSKEMRATEWGSVVNLHGSMSHIFLARAEHALGNAAAAAALMTQVRSTTAQAGALEPAVISLIERIEREIEAPPGE